MSNRNGNIIRKHKTKNFTLVDNSIMKNKSMSLKAKGLLVLLLSLPDDWEFSESGLTALSKDGRDGLRSGLKELEDLGHLKRTQEMTGGKFGKVIYNIYEIPLLEKPISEKPKSEIPKSEKPHNKVLNNKVLNNKVLNNTIVESKDSTIPYKEIIDYLNDKTNKNYRNVKTNQRLIKARFNEGYTLEDFKQVIDNMNAAWGNDNKMKNYLRPATLFGTKFDSYLNYESGRKEEIELDIKMW